MLPPSDESRCRCSTSSLGIQGTRLNWHAFAGRCGQGPGQRRKKPLRRTPASAKRSMSLEAHDPSRTGTSTSVKETGREGPRTSTANRWRAHASTWRPGGPITGESPRPSPMPRAGTRSATWSFPSSERGPMTSAGVTKDRSRSLARPTASASPGSTQAVLSPAQAAERHVEPGTLRPSQPLRGERRDRYCGSHPLPVFPERSSTIRGSPWPASAWSMTADPLTSDRQHPSRSSLGILNERDTAPPSMKIRTTDDAGRFAFEGMPVVRVPDRCSGQWISRPLGLYGDEPRAPARPATGSPVFTDDFKLTLATADRMSRSTSCRADSRKLTAPGSCLASGSMIGGPRRRPTSEVGKNRSPVSEIPPGNYPLRTLPPLAGTSRSRHRRQARGRARPIKPPASAGRVPRAARPRSSWSSVVDADRQRVGTPPTSTLDDARRRWPRSDEVSSVREMARRS